MKRLLHIAVLVLGIALLAAPAGGAAPNLVGSTSAWADPSNVLTISKPDGVSTGTTLLAVVNVRLTGTQARVTAPAGWTLVRRDQSTSGDKLTQEVYVRVAGSSEPTSYVWKFANNTASAGAILAYGGVDRSSPVLAHSGRFTSSSTTITAPSVTASAAGSAVVGFFGNSARQSVSPPSGMSERFDVVANGRWGISVEGADLAMSSAAATGDKSAQSGSSSSSIGQLVALRPASSTVFVVVNTGSTSSTSGSTTTSTTSSTSGSTTTSTTSTSSGSTTTSTTSSGSTTTSTTSSGSGSTIPAGATVVLCGQAIPSSVGAGTTVHVKGPCTYKLRDAIRVPNNGVTYEFEPGVVLDGQRIAGNAFYLNGGDDVKLIGLDLGSKPRMINFAETVIYASGSDRFLLHGLYTGFSGNDTGSSYLDHGVYVDGCIGFVIEDHVAEGMSAHGIQIYSGSSRTTTGVVRRAKLFNNRGDGLHVGNASTNSVFTQIEAFGNKNWGLRFYSGTGSQLVGSNWSYSNVYGPIRVDKYTAEPTPKQFFTTAP